MAQRFTPGMPVYGIILKDGSLAVCSKETYDAVPSCGTVTITHVDRKTKTITLSAALPVANP